MDSNVKEIVVLSGKGGAGKTSLTASFAVLAGKHVVSADCDVDAADMHLLLAPDYSCSEEFYAGKLAVIDSSACIDCGRCADVCSFDALRRDADAGSYSVLPHSCEGCGYCARVCPVQAIQMQERLAGHWYRSHIRTGGILIHAALGIGSDNSGKLVAKVKSEARTTAALHNRALVLVDGSPGIGCPVVSSLSGADMVVFVTEPTVSGLHDLQRVAAMAEKFGIPACCVINKADIRPDMTVRIKQYLADAGIRYAGSIPYDGLFSQAILNQQTAVETGNSDIKRRIQQIWASVLDAMMDKEEGV